MLATMKQRLWTTHRKVLRLGAVVLMAVLTACSSSDSDSEGSGASTGGTPGNPGSSLSALPNPPLTPAPGNDDEPIAEPGTLNTVTDFALVRDPGPRIPKVEAVELTDADFEAGPLEPVTVVPPGVDPALNAAPYFENLTDQIVTAGEVLEVLYKPIDPDGDVPGMFPEELPPGASFDDNFDGTKTYRWQPLQMDVGINEFTVTAIDPLNNQYRTTQTIRIKVVLPDDPSSIPNVAPVLDEFLSHTVRVNDPVVLELKGIDFNGSVPTLELLSSIDGASFVQHPRFAEVFVLRFIPRTVGEQVIELVIRDSVDTSLFNTESVSINVLPESAFTRSGERLKNLAAARSIDFGYASLQSFYHRPDGGIYADTAANEFNLVTPENSMKMDHLNPLPGRYQFADTDNLITFAQLHSMKVHGHPLVWYRQLPQWLLEQPTSSIEGHMREYIHRVMSRYASSISLWDVVNEPLADNGGLRSSLWHDAIGESYIDIAFLQARATAPTATLLLNEFDIAVNGPKADSLFTLLDNLQSRDVPIDGVGFQMHVFSSFNQFDEVQQNFQKVADRGLDIYITELDVALVNNDDFNKQADVYRNIVEVCLNQPRCKAIQTWGFTDQYSFRKIFEPLLFDDAYTTKPAYSAVQSVLESQ